MLPDGIICGHIGEFGWEVLRFAPHVFWLMKEKYPDHKLILYTREDRIDLYGDLPDEIIICGLNNDRSDCFTFNGIDDKEYKEIQKHLIEKMSNKYNIKHVFFPEIKDRRYTEKYQIPENQKIYDFKAPKKCLEMIDRINFLRRPFITIAPRFRKGFKRNWPHWDELFKIIFRDDEFFNRKFSYLICGYPNQYIKAPGFNFLDVNSMTEGSVAGVTMAAISRSVVTIGSQSGIPNLSNLMGTPTIQWGNEEHLHKNVYNVKNTECIFIEDMKFDCSPDIVLGKLKSFLQNLNKEK